MRAYAQETNRQNYERRAQAEVSRRALEKIERSIKGIMDAIEDGMYQPAIGELMAILDLAAGRRRSPRPEVITNALAVPAINRFGRKPISA